MSPMTAPSAVMSQPGGCSVLTAMPRPSAVSSCGQPGQVTGQDGPGHLGGQRFQAQAGRLQGCQSQLHPSQDSRRDQARQTNSLAPPLTYAGKYLHNAEVDQYDARFRAPAGGSGSGAPGGDAVFKALADPTRRALLDRLRERNGQTLGELCEPLDMARQSAT